MHSYELEHKSTGFSITRFVSFLLLAFISIQSSASDRLPKGKDYPIEHIYTGKPAAYIDTSDEFTNLFRTRFKEAIQGDIAFAGEYALVGWGCGSSGCYTTAFINKRTGRALTNSFMVYDAGDSENSKYIGEEILYINKNSKLLVTHEISDTSEDQFYNYYVLKNNSLTLIQKVKDTSPQNP